jgi:hypothetical protein
MMNGLMVDRILGVSCQSAESASEEVDIRKNDLSALERVEKR